MNPSYTKCAAYYLVWAVWGNHRRLPDTNWVRDSSDWVNMKIYENVLWDSTVGKEPPRARVDLGRASREFVYKRGIGSPPESDRTSLSVHSLTLSLVVLCSTGPLFTQLKVTPGPPNIYHSASGHIPPRTHVGFKTQQLQLCGQWQKKCVLIAVY